jgi:hypothetical protein
MTVFPRRDNHKVFLFQSAVKAGVFNPTYAPSLLSVPSALRCDLIT